MSTLEREIPFYDEQDVPPQPIKIVVYDGTVMEVQKGDFEAVPVKVYDYDIDGTDHNDLDVDDEGTPCIISEW